MAGPHRYARGFGETAAAAYDDGRAPYVPEVVAALGIEPGTRVLDLGAGTGLLSKALVDAGLEVLAVEPGAEMRERLTARLGSDNVLEGSAEAIPLPDESVEAVTAGDAFHWFDPSPAAAEIHRVLKPGGKLALIWRYADWWQVGEPPAWAVALGERLDALRGDHPGFSADQGRGGVEAHDGFSPWENAQVKFTVAGRGRSSLATQLESISYIALLPDDERAATVAELSALPPEGGYDEPHVAQIWTTHKL